MFLNGIGFLMNECPMCEEIAKKSKCKNCTGK